MPMQSTNLLDALRELPGGSSNHRRSFRDTVAGLVNTDRAFYAAEGVSSVSLALWPVFQRVNVDDRVLQAYEMQYANEAQSVDLHDKWNEVLERGEQSAVGFVSGIKGKLAEIQTAEQLEDAGYTDVDIAENPTQPIYDITAISPDGEAVSWQVKVGDAGRAGEIESLMGESPDLHFAVNTEIYDRIAERSPELLNRLLDVGSLEQLDGTAAGALTLLSDNMGLDIPDGVAQMIPYAGAILAGARLVYSVLKTEREFSAADRTTRNKIQVVQSLTVMSRMGVSTVMATVGGAGGTAAGSFLPGVGNLIGGIVGAVAGAGMGMYLNRHLEPHMLDLALDITDLTDSDLFYYKNKEQVDQLALSYRQTAIALAAPSQS